MKLLITGATGLIGKNLITHAKRRRISIHFLTTRKGECINSAGLKGFFWNPEQDEIDDSCFEGVDTLIHLAGANISKPWTNKNKEVILDSRLNSTRLLKKTLDRLNIKMKSICCAGAIGIYPNSIDDIHHENSPLSQENFLQKVTYAWEQESKALSKNSLNLSIFRIGLVLAKEGGLLSKLTPPVKLFLGTAFASGTQWQSWIHIDDLSRLFFRAVDDGWDGTFNAVAPNPISQINLIKEIGRTLKRPVFLPNIPAFFLQLFMGERSLLVLGSHRVSAKLILSKGFKFQFPYLQPALNDILKKKNDNLTKKASWQ